MSIEPSHSEILHQLGELRLEIKDVSDRQASLAERGQDYRVLIARLDETMKTYGQTLEVHSRAIEAALGRIEQLEKDNLVESARRDTLVGLLNNKLTQTLITFLSGAIGYAIFTHFM